MKKHFLTGLAVLLPLAVTIAVMIFFINFVTAPFIDMTDNFLTRWGVFQDGFLFLSSKQAVRFASQLLILAGLFATMVLLGMLTRWFFVFSILKLGERIVHQIPVISTIYKTVKDVIETIFATNTGAFKQVVMLPFPSTDTFTVGLVTREEVPSDEDGEKLVAVFVPTTPNPTSGYLVMYKKEDVVYLDISVEEAFKYIISCGVISTPLRDYKTHQPVTGIEEAST